jgi:hypothetical protein
MIEKMVVVLQVLCVVFLAAGCVLPLLQSLTRKNQPRERHEFRLGAANDFEIDFRRTANQRRR